MAKQKSTCSSGEQFRSRPLVQKPLPALGATVLPRVWRFGSRAPDCHDRRVRRGATPEIRLRGVAGTLRRAVSTKLAAATAVVAPRNGSGRDAPAAVSRNTRLRDARRGYRGRLRLRIADSSVSAALQVARGGPRLRVAARRHRR
jgi:hypothetical protein